MEGAMDPISGYRMLVDELKHDMSNVAIFLVGKAVAVSEDEYHKLSDVDLVVVRLAESPFERQIEDVNGLSMDISYISLGDLKTQIVLENHVWLEVAAKGSVIHVQEWFSGALVDIREDASSIISRGPKRPDSNEIAFLRYTAGQSLVDLGKRSEGDIEFEYLAWNLIEDLIRISFRLGAIWPVKPKKQLMNVERHDPELHAIIGGFTRSSEKRVKLELLQKMARHVLEPVGGTTLTFAKGIYPLDK
jgi:hypothetical protein